MMFKNLYLKTLLLLALIPLAPIQAADCDDYAVLASYGVIGENSFQAGNNSTINGNNLSGSGNTPTPTGNMTTIDEDFPALVPATFPATGGANITRTSNFTLNAGSYGTVKLDKTNRTITMTGGDYYIKELILAKNGDVVSMAPGNYYVENFSMDQSTSLNLTGSGQVKIYIKNSMQIGNQSSLNGGGEVGNLMIFLYSGASFQVGNANQGGSAGTIDFAGIIYSPYDNTSIQFGNNNDIEGAILSEGDVQVGNNTDFTYDADTENEVLQAFGCSGGGSSEVADDFNCVSTGQNAISGKLFTRVAGVNLNVDIYALNDTNADSVGDEVEDEYADDADRKVTFELVDASSGSCATYTSIYTLPDTDANALTFTAASDGYGSLSGLNISNAYSNVKCRITDNNETSPVPSCSTDSFVIRPASLVVSVPSSINNSGSSGLPKAVAGSAFTLAASAVLPDGSTVVTGYNGTPVADNSAIDSHVGGTAGTLTGTFPQAVNGVSTGTDAFSYTEVGNFRFQTGAITDKTFVSNAIDTHGVECISSGGNEFSTTEVGGLVGCYMRNESVSDYVGRFIPTGFEITATDGMLMNNCGATFSYFNKDIEFSTAPTITITALNGDSSPVASVNYSDFTGAGGNNYAHLTSAGSYAVSTETPATFPVTIPQFAVTGTHAVTGGNVTYNLDDSSADDDSADSFTTAINVAGSPGVFETYFNGLKLNYEKTTSDLVAPFSPNPNVSLSFTLQVDDGDGVVSSQSLSITPADNTLNPVLVRYGRLNLQNAYGSELHDLTLPLQLEYYNGPSDGFIAATDDTCSASITTVYVKDLNTSDGLVISDPAPETCILDGTSCYASTYDAGNNERTYTTTLDPTADNLTLQAPGANNTGILQVRLEVPDWLKFDWNGDGSADDPSATASFGIHNRDSRTIFLKEIR